MKKVLVFLLVLMLVTPAMGLAADVAIAPGVNWTEVIVCLIGAIMTAISALLARVWMDYVKPWLEQRGLTDAAHIVVNAVEALLGRYGGEDKWRLALEKMQERGFDVDSEEVLDALKAAWEQMNISQIAAGVKDAPVDVG